MAAPAAPLMSNVTAAPVAAPDEIKNLLVQQVTATVRWRECVLAMRSAEIEELVELGCGKVLSGMVKRIDKEMTARNAETPADIDALLTAL